MAVGTSNVVAIDDSSQVAAARRSAERLASRLGFAERRIADVALIATELATNILKHAGSGQILLSECRVGGHRGMELLAIDSGPGFSVPAAMRDGHSTAGSLGHGLGALRRIAGDFEVFSQPGKGSVALARVWPDAGRRPEAPLFAVSAVNVPKPGEETSGDSWAADVGPHRAAIMVADGLGHGLLAAEAAAAAVGVFERDPFRNLTLMLDDMHQALRPTRGAAVAIASIEFERDVAIFAGVGNIAGVIVADHARRNLVSHNGTAGHVARRMQEFSYPMPREATLVLHSDGLATGWNPAEYPGLWTSDPAITAAVLYRDFARKRDDVTVVVGRRRVS